MDLMDDQDLKKSVIDQMMGELDDETASSLKKPAAPIHGVEIAITVSPKTGEMPEGDEEAPEEAEGMPKAEDEDDEDYISQLLKKLG